MGTEKKLYRPVLTNVPETMLVPLFLKAKETKEKGIIADSKSVDIISEMDYDFSGLEKDWITQVSVAIRTHLFDQILSSQILISNRMLSWPAWEPAAPLWVCANT